VDRRGGGGNKAAWEALVVVGALLVGAAAGFWFSEQRNAARYQAVEDELAKLEREDDGVALRTYFDQMAQLLLDRNLLGSEDDGEVQQLARARTFRTPISPAPSCQAPIFTSPSWGAPTSPTPS
jgi:hypothetical protein